MSIPTKVEHFVAIGERYFSEDIVNEADRLVPLATADIDRLATRGYGQSDTNKLQGLRAALVAEVAGRNQGPPTWGSRYVAVRGVLKRGARVHRLEDASGFAIVGG